MILRKRGVRDVPAELKVGIQKETSVGSVKLAVIKAAGVPDFVASVASDKAGRT